MIKFSLSIILSLLFCQISAYGQTFDSTKLSVGRNRILNSHEFGEASPHSSSFKVKLDGVVAKKKLIQGQDLLADPDAARVRNQPILEMLKSGGESAGGGHLLELKIAASVQKMFEGLQKKNPNNLNLDTLQYFIENTVIKFSNEKKEFLLQRDKNSSEMELRDAVNFFPQQWILKLYTPAWEKYYALKLDVEDLLYHEFLLFFFKHDQKYSRSKFADLGNSRVSVLTLVLTKFWINTADAKIFNRLQLVGFTVNSQESLTVYCRLPSAPSETSIMTVRYQGDSPGRSTLIASTENLPISPFVGCDGFKDIERIFLLATPSCPVVVDLDRKAVEDGNVVLLGIRNTCVK